MITVIIAIITIVVLEKTIGKLRTGNDIFGRPLE